MSSIEESPTTRAVTRALLVSAAISPLVTIPATLLVALSTIIVSRARGTPESLGAAGSAFLVTSFFAVAVAYLAMVIVGLPSALLALRARKPTLLPALLMGSVTGLIVWLILHANDQDVRSAVLMIYYGCVVSATFVAIFRMRMKAAARRASWHLQRDES